MTEKSVHQAGDLATVTGAMTAVGPAELGGVRELKRWSEIQHVLRSKDFEPPRPEDGFGVPFQSQILGNSLVELHGDDHFERRRLESVLFRRDTLLAYERDLVRPALQEAIAQLRLRPDDEVVRTDLVELAHRVSLGLTMTLLGLDEIDTPEGIDEFGRLFEPLDAGARAKYTTRNPQDVVNDALAAQRRVMDEHFWPAWRRREQLLADGHELPNDLVSLMIRNRDHFAKWDETVVEREATLFIAASVATTGNEVCHAVREIEGWIAAHPEHAEKRTDEAFLARAFDESARLHAMGWMIRAAVRDTTLPDGTPLNDGDVVWLDFRAAYEELYGPSASRFDPFREQSAQLPRYGLAFGDGRHTCIGKMLVLGDDDRHGTARTVMLELYRAGMRLDPERPPRVTRDSVREMVESCPIVLDPE